MGVGAGGEPAVIDPRSSEPTDSSCFNLTVVGSGACPVIGPAGNADTFKTILGVLPHRTDEDEDGIDLNAGPGTTKTVLKITVGVAFTICCPT